MSSSDFRHMYDNHSDYVERRDPKSLAAHEIDLEAREFKVPNLLAVLPRDMARYGSIIEIGCATGEVLAAFPDVSPEDGGKISKVGFDISPKNLEAASARYPHITFLDSAFTEYTEQADVVVLSDVLEHIPDDVEFLRQASQLGSVVLVNLPLEDNWTNRNRAYGVDDPSGHLRAYSLDDALTLAKSANLEVLQWARIWGHETSYDLRRRALRRSCTGAAHSGTAVVRAAKTFVYFSARLVRPFGRRLFPSNLFFSARSRETPP